MKIRIHSPGFNVKGNRSPEMGAKVLKIIEGNVKWVVDLKEPSKKKPKSKKATKVLVDHDPNDKIPGGGLGLHECSYKKPKRGR